MKPMFPTYVLQSLQGHLSVFQDFIFSLFSDFALLISLGINSHSFVAKRRYTFCSKITVRFACLCITAFAWNALMLCNCLCSSSPSSPSRSSALSGISENLEQKTISQTTKQIIQFRVLEIQFRPLKYMTGIRIRKNLSNIPFLSKR